MTAGQDHSQCCNGCGHASHKRRRDNPEVQRALYFAAIKQASADLNEILATCETAARLARLALRRAHETAYGPLEYDKEPKPIGEMPGNPSRSEYQEWHERNIGG